MYFLLTWTFNFPKVQCKTKHKAEMAELSKGLENIYIKLIKDHILHLHCIFMHCMEHLEQSISTDRIHLSALSKLASISAQGAGGKAPCYPGKLFTDFWGVCAYCCTVLCQPTLYGEQPEHYHPLIKQSLTVLLNVLLEHGSGKCFEYRQLKSNNFNMLYLKYAWKIEEIDTHTIHIYIKIHYDPVDVLLI